VRIVTRKFVIGLAADKVKQGSVIADKLDLGPGTVPRPERRRDSSRITSHLEYFDADATMSTCWRPDHATND